MMSEVEASLIFRRRQHKTQSEILRLRFAPLRMTKNNVVDRSSGDNPGDFRNQGLLQLLESASAVGGLKDVAG